jgi:hypothetical protein
MGSNRCIQASSRRDAAVDILADATTDVVVDTTSSEVATSDTQTTDVQPADLSPGVDVVTDATASDHTDVALDLGTDAAVDGISTDVRTDVAMPDVIAMDVPVAPRCGHLSEMCCGFRTFATACRDGLICNAPTGGRCVDVPRAPMECVSGATCTTDRVCGGPVGCSGRFCYLCTLPGPRAFDSMCDPAMAGRECASGVCINDRCTYACRPGADGDTECQRLAPNSHCVAQQYGLDFSGGTPARVATLGRCIPGCVRNSDCTGGRVCVGAPNLFDDRFDFVCATSTLPGAAGAVCIPNSPTPTCQSGFCITDEGSTTRGHCTAPCTSATDCPTSAPVCDFLTLSRPITGNPQVTRGCFIS